MTVSELIFILNKYESDKHIYIEDFHQTLINKISDIYIDDDGDLRIRGGNE